MRNPFRRHSSPGIFWLTEQLAQGNRDAAANARGLLSEGIDCVLNLQEADGPERRQVESVGLLYRHFPMAEFVPPTVEQLEEGSRIALEVMGRGKTVFVYCRLGQSRSVCMACAIYVAMGRPLALALQEYRSAGRGALNSRQLEALAELERRVGAARAPE